MVIAGEPKARLSDKSVEVEFLLHSTHLSLDSEYYIGKTIIPPLERIFSLVGANVQQWYDEMPKYQGLRKITKRNADGSEDNTKKRATKKAMTLESYLTKSTTACAVCEQKAETRNCNYPFPISTCHLLIPLFSKLSAGTAQMNAIAQYISCKLNLRRRRNETPIFKLFVGPAPDFHGVRRLSATLRLAQYIIQGFDRLPSWLGKGRISNHF